MRRGRPIGSAVRQHMVEILFHIGQGHGYQIYKIYRDLFPKVTLRVIYYHLRKGVDLGEFVVEKVRMEKGDYSWGSEAEKIYYKLGDAAKAQGDERIKAYLDAKKNNNTPADNTSS